MKKKMFAALMAACMTVSVFGSVVTASAADGVTLTLYGNADDLAKPYMQKIISLWEESSGNKIDQQGLDTDNAETIALTKEAEKLGIETCLIVCPFYNKPTQEGIYQHFKSIAENTTCNILLYNIPIFVGVNIEAETVSRLAEIPNIVGIKDEAGINPTQVTDFFLATEKIDPEFAIYNGDDVMLLPTIVQGAMGLVSGGAHIFGHEIRKIFECFAEGKNEEAKELFIPLYRFCKTTGQNGRILPNSIMRPAVELVTGIKLGPARSPLAPATDEEMAVTIKVLKEIGKL